MRAAQDTNKRRQLLSMGGFAVLCSKSQSHASQLCKVAPAQVSQPGASVRAAKEDEPSGGSCEALMVRWSGFGGCAEQKVLHQDAAHAARSKSGSVMLCGAEHAHSQHVIACFKGEAHVLPGECRVTHRQSALQQASLAAASLSSQLLWQLFWPMGQAPCTVLP